MRINLENPKRSGDRTKFSFIILTFLFSWMFLVVVNVAGGSGRIENIRLNKEGDFTHVTIYADNPFVFSHSTVEAKDGKPYRLVIDCQDVVFGLPQHDFKEGIPSGIIEAIRTSQFQVVPERIVRIVLDLKGPVVYKVVETSEENNATIAILTTQEPDFPTWQAVKEDQKENQSVRRKDTQTSISSTKITSKTVVETKESVALLPTSHKSFDSASPEKTVVKPIQKGEVFRKAVSFADTGETAPALSGISNPPQPDKPVVLTQAQSEEKDTKEDINKEEIVSQSGQKKAGLPTTELSPKVSSEQITRQTESASDQEKAKKMGVKEMEQGILSSIAGSVPKPSSQTKVEESPLSSKEGLSERSSAKKQISGSPAPAGPSTEEKSSLVEKTEKGKMSETKAQTATETEKKKNVPTDVGNTVQKGIGAILGTEGASAKESDSLLEGSTLIQNPPQSELGLIPSRKIITYNPETRRDPFLPLTGKEQMNFGAAPLPRFENLKLVGIIKDKLGNQALLEDEIGFGYILKSGDQIKNGYVISIEDNKVVFHVEEYGGYKIMTLELNPEY
jgi:hypothetical protein